MKSDDLYAHIQENPELIVAYIHHCEETIQSLERTVQSQKTLIAELRRQLNQNSKNSSRPPSSDGFKRPQNKRKTGVNRPGGQKGHKGYTLKWCDTPDVIETHRSCVCENCGASLEDVPPATVEQRQVVDIPPQELIVTEHHGEDLICPHCGHYNKASFPSDVQSTLQYGMNIRALMVYLCIYQLLPYERVTEAFSDIYGRTPSKGTLVKAVSDCAENLAGVEAQIKDLLVGAKVLNVDETGMRVEGKREWLHTSSTECLTLYSHHRKRGGEAMDEIGIIPEFEGTLVHDCWSPYFKYSCRHALCNAHLMRELEGIFENTGQEWSHDMQDLLIEIYKSVCETPEPAFSLETLQIEEYKRRYNAILERGIEEIATSTSYYPVQKGKRERKKRSKAENLIRRCSKYQGEFLRFMSDFQVPFTNNLAERDIRMMKVQQKISGTFRSRKGASNFCRVRGYISTVKKNDVKVLSAIRGIFEGKPFIPTVAHRYTVE